MSEVYRGSESSEYDAAISDLNELKTEVSTNLNSIRRTRRRLFAGAFLSAGLIVGGIGALVATSNGEGAKIVACEAQHPGQEQLCRQQSKNVEGELISSGMIIAGLGSGVISAIGLMDTRPTLEMYERSEKRIEDTFPS